MLKQVVSFYQFMQFLVIRFFEDRGTQNAGSLTYTTLFAVVPMMTVIFVMIAGIPAFQGVEVSIQQYILHNFMPAASDKIVDYLNSFVSQARNLTWIGIIFLIITTFMMLVTIESAFNTIWRVKKARNGLPRFLLYWALLSLGPLLIGAGFAASTYIMSLNFFSESTANPLVANVLRLVPVVATAGGFTLFYAAIPNTRVPIHHAIISAIVTAVLLEAARAIFGFYVKAFPSYQLIYGAFAAFPLFLLWIYVSWVIVLIGCELCCCLGLRHTVNRPRVPELVIVLCILKLFHDGQLKGRAVTYSDIKKEGWILPGDEWAKLLDFFISEELIHEVDSGGAWVLSRDISHYPLQRLIAKSPWPLPRMEQLPSALNDPWFEKIKVAIMAIEQEESKIFEGSLAFWFAESNDELSNKQSDL